MNPNNIIVNDYQVINANPTAMSTKPVTELTDQELKEEMQRRAAAKENDRQAYKQTVAETIPQIFLSLEAVSNTLTNLKTSIFSDISNLLQLKQSVYGIKKGQQSHTFTTEDGKSISIGYRVTDGWDETVSAGIEKINQFMESLAKNEESAKLVNVINKLLKKDAKGNLKANRVVELQQMASDFNSPLFDDGIKIIVDSYKPVKSSYFIEASITNDTGTKIHLPLSISSAKFLESANLDLSYFNQFNNESCK